MISKTISYLFCTSKKLKLLISLEVEAMLLKQVKLASFVGGSLGNDVEAAMSPRKVLIDVISAFLEYRLRTKSCILPKISSEKSFTPTLFK
jgi:hypothetical protein